VLARIYANVVDGRARPSQLRGVPLGLRLATLMVLLLMSLATAKGAMILWQRYVSPVVEPVVPAPLAAPKKLAAVAAPKKPVEIAPAVEPIAVPAPPRPRRLAAAERHSPAPRVIPVPVPAADPVNEAQLLADALARLRQQHDPRGALAVLDQYARTYPHGVLASESRSARIEAMLKLNDRAGALELLDEGASFTGRLGGEQLLTRGELRASVGRYADALADFDRLLAPSGPLGASPLAASIERALYGRAVTLGHLGRDQRARADLQEYQRRFPAGKNAAEVARLLGGEK
ncbi:MAG TPA: tetratricopeptide repeat protein, partial [Polyangia bacterium]|nr:tetratricopeptide repeat protein [Polyangia bacterium]